MKYWRQHFRENPGSPFVMAFIASLILTAGLLLLSKYDYANYIVTAGFLLLIPGVALQISSFYESYKKSEEVQ